MASTLHTMDISNVSEAAAAFGSNPGLIVARPAAPMCCLPYRMVPEGYYALVTTNGAEVTHQSGSVVWPAGCFYAGPFTNVEHLVTKRFIVFDAPVKGCKTRDNVEVQIDVSVVFRIMGNGSTDVEDPRLVRKFVHEVTPNGLEQQLKDALAEEIRRLARSMKHTEVYACRTASAAGRARPMGFAPDADPAAAKLAEAASAPPDDYRGAPEAKAMERDSEVELQGKTISPMQSQAEDDPPAANAGVAREPDETEIADEVGAQVTREMMSALNNQFNEQGVQIADIMIQNIVLPQEIAQQMTNKTLVRSKQEYEVMEQKFEMQSIGLSNEIDKVKISNKETEEKLRVLGGRDSQAARDALAERESQRERELAEVTEHTRAEVAKINAESVEVTTKLEFEKQQVLQTLALEAQEEAKMLKVNNETAVKKLKEETAAEVSKINAESEETKTKLSFEKSQRLQTLNLEAEEESRTLKANTDADTRRLAAETKFTVARNEGEAQTTISAAEEKANAHLAKARQLEITEKNLKVYQALAANDKVVLSDSKDKDFNMMMLADNVMAGGAAGAQSHDQIMADLNMLRLASAAYGLRDQTYIPDPASSGSAVVAGGTRR